MQSGCPVVKDAFESFLPNPKRNLSTRGKYRYKLAAFLREYGELPVSQVDDCLVAGWFKELEKGNSEATMSMYRACFLTFFKYCMGQKWLGSNPAASLPRYDDSPKLIKTANESHLETVLNHCQVLSELGDPRSRRDAVLFALAAVSGARSSNLMMLPYRQTVACLEHPIYDPDVGNIYTVATAGKQPCEIVFGDWHTRLIRQYLEVRPLTGHDRFFVHLDAKCKTYGDPLGPNGLAKARCRVCKQAGVPVITFTDMRKLKATKIARAYGLELAAQALGHRSGTDVIRRFYYDPDKHATRVAILRTGRR